MNPASAVKLAILFLTLPSWKGDLAVFTKPREKSSDSWAEAKSDSSSAGTATVPREGLADMESQSSGRVLVPKTDEAMVYCQFQEIHSISLTKVEGCLPCSRY